MKTPYFVIRKDLLEEGLCRLRAALQSAWPNYEIGYSYKTNTLPWVIRWFAARGCAAEVVSEDEYLLARAIGAEKIIYNGIVKSKDTFLDAVMRHETVNIDAEYEIDWLSALPAGDWRVGIRANFDLESRCPGQTQCGEEGERFGFCVENGELGRAIDRIRAAGVRVSGLHLHKSSKTRMPAIYEAIAEAAVAIADDCGLSLDYVDIGGGFFGGLPTKPPFAEYMALVAGILRRRFSPETTALIVEPGMALIGAAVDYVTTVLDVKKTTRNVFVVTDGSRTQIDPLMTKTAYFNEIIRQDAPSGENGTRQASPSREILPRQIVSGFTCMEHDRLFELRNQPALLPGDRIVYHKVGAYTQCLSPLFIRWFPAVYVRSGENGTPEKIRNPLTAEEFLALR